MHKIIFLPENNMCVYLKFSDPLPLTPLFFIWPNHLTGVEGGAVCFTVIVFWGVYFACMHCFLEFFVLFVFHLRWCLYSVPLPHFAIG